MSKLLCPCGNRLSDVLSPHPHVGYMVSEVVMDQDDFGDRVIQKQCPEYWECPECGRFAIFEMNSNRVKWWKPEPIEEEHV